jgi:hypothetical protein
MRTSGRSEVRYDLLGKDVEQLQSYLGYRGAVRAYYRHH